MKTKLILFASCLAALALSASVAVASPRGGGGGFNGGSRGNGFNGATRMGAPGSFRSGSRFNPAMSRNFRNFRGDRDFRHRRFNDFVFFGGFGDPFFYPDPYFYGYYPYGYPPYGYGYGYAPYDQSGYGYQGGGYGYQGQGTGGGSEVAQLQLRLKRAGFYHGRIDGVMGPQTRYALRNYQRSHNSRETEG